MNDKEVIVRRRRGVNRGRKDDGANQHEERDRIDVRSTASAV